MARNRGPGQFPSAWWLPVSRQPGRPVRARSCSEAERTPVPAADSSTGTPGQRSPRVLWWVPPTPGWGGRGGRHHSPTGVSGSRVPTAAAGSLQHSRWDCGGTSAIAWCAHDALTHLDAEPSSDHGRSFGCRMLQSSATYLSTPVGPSVGLLTAPNRPPKMRVGRTRSGWRSAPVTRRPGGSLHVGWHH